MSYTIDTFVTVEYIAIDLIFAVFIEFWSLLCFLFIKV
jgi:hypothetical protein